MCSLYCSRSPGQVRCGFQIIPHGVTHPLVLVFSALRAFVLSRSKLVGLLILALSLAPVGANIVRQSSTVTVEASEDPLATYCYTHRFRMDSTSPDSCSHRSVASRKTARRMRFR